MTCHCLECGSELCNHGNCPECTPCKHCSGGDRSNKRFPENEEDRDDCGFDYYDKMHREQ